MSLLDVSTGLATAFRRLGVLRCSASAGPAPEVFSVSGLRVVPEGFCPRVPGLFFGIVRRLQSSRRRGVLGDRTLRVDGRSRILPRAALTLVVLVLAHHILLHNIFEHQPRGTRASSAALRGQDIGCSMTSICEVSRRNFSDATHLLGMRSRPPERHQIQDAYQRKLPWQMKRHWKISSTTR